MKPDFTKLMEEAQKMQARMQQAQKDLENMVVCGVAGGDLVKVEMNGRHDVKKITIDEDLFEENKSMVEDLIAAAVNDAVRKIENETRSKMAGITAGFKLPEGNTGDGGES